MAVRILLSAYACDPDAGTEPGNGWNWAWHLAEAGHEVWVLTGGQGAHRRRERADGMPALHLVEVPAPSIGKRWLRGAPRGHLRYALWLRRSYPVAKALADTTDFDVVHHVTFGSLVWGSPLWRLEAPFVFGPVGGGQVTPPSLLPYLARARHRVIERLRGWLLGPLMRCNPMARATLRNATVVLVANSDTLRLVERCGTAGAFVGWDTAVPPRMVPPARERASRDPVPSADLRSSNGLATILWVGRLLPRKGLPLALEALSRVARTLPWECIVLGDGPLAGDVGGWLGRLGIEDRVRWEGSVPWHRIGRYYERADLFLFTSLRDANGAQLLEAAAFGLPIVGLRHQGVKDLVPDAVSIKVPVTSAGRTADALARAIESLIVDPSQRAAMGSAAARFALANTWPRRVAEVYGIVERSIARPAS